ncbi:MAG: hypothetical protein MUF45_14535 [Spirosomaceae bacterium]|nr:hypothetical protein [Spirosomataceae bacterium]
MKEKLKPLINDPVLKPIIEIIPEPQIESTKNVFSDLMSCILEQQIVYRSTKKIFQKMLDSAQITELTPDNFEEFEKTALTNTKLSMNKYETIERVVDFWQTNNIDWFLLSDKEVKGHLGSIKGIGVWTIDMILLYTLQRPNVFPYDDFHLKQIMVNLYGLNPDSQLKKQMLEISERWSEQKSLAVKYLLAWKEYNKKTPK